MVDAPEGAAVVYDVTITGPEGFEVVEPRADGAEFTLSDGLVDGETYTVTRAEVEGTIPASFEVGEDTDTFNDASVVSGTTTLLAGTDEEVTFAATNQYGCVEVLDSVEEQPETDDPQVEDEPVTTLVITGAPALLALLGLFGVGLGGVMVRGGRRDWLAVAANRSGWGGLRAAPPRCPWDRGPSRCTPVEGTLHA